MYSRGWKFWIKKLEEFYCTFCFCISKLLVFLWHGSISCLHYFQQEREKEEARLEEEREKPGQTKEEEKKPGFDGTWYTDINEE